MGHVTNAKNLKVWVHIKNLVLMVNQSFFYLHFYFPILIQSIDDSTYHHPTAS